MQEFSLRSEQKKDYPQIEFLLTTAFNGCEEARLVDRIRQTSAYINSLSIVACENEQPIGFIMLSYVTLHSPKNRFKLLSLAPMAVLPSLQRQGIGSSLIHETIRSAEKLEESAIIVLGHKEYYSRFGFERASLHGIYPPVVWPDESYMIYRLSNYTPQLAGTVSYPPAWQI